MAGVIDKRAANYNKLHYYLGYSTKSNLIEDYVASSNQAPTIYFYFTFCKTFNPLKLAYSSKSSGLTAKICFNKHTINQLNRV